jgi:glycosyltransferase involved in cell wall biosynthesis
MIPKALQSEWSDGSHTLEVCVVTYLPSPYQVELFNEVAKQAKVHLRVVYLRSQDRIHHWGDVTIAHEHLILSGTGNGWKTGMEWCTEADVTVFNFYTHPFALTALLCRAVSGKPWVFWGEQPGFLRLGRLGKWGRKSLLAPIRWCGAPVWGVGESGVRSYQQDWGPDHRYVNFPYYSNLDRFQKIDKPPSTQTRTILFSGVLSARKGALELAVAFAKAALSFPFLRLLILGAGPLEDAMRKRLDHVKDQVTWFGFQPWERLPEVYAQADVLCLPTHHDGWGMVVPEALAAGLPVLATRASIAASELVEDQVSGWLIDAPTPNNLSNAITTIATMSQEHLARMSLAARGLIKTHHLVDGAAAFAQECFEAMQAFGCHKKPSLESRVCGNNPSNWSLLITGSYRPDQLHSMDRYSNLVAEAGRQAGAHVTQIPCPSFLGGLSFISSGIRKWLGHIDKYLLYPVKLRWTACRQKKQTLIHVTDQGLGPLLVWVKDFPHLLTCHDLIAIRSILGEMVSKTNSYSGSLFQRLNLQILKQADTIICVSEKTKSDCLRVLGPSVHCEIVMNPLDPAFLEPAAPSTPPLPLPLFPEHFFLHVGNSLWYKNRPGVLRIFKLLRRHRSEKLVLMGSAPTDFESQLSHDLGVSEDVIWITHPPTDWIKMAYDKAVALIFPSLEEGFGWPIIEAMSRGCPVFASKRPPLTEIAGDAAVYFDPESPEDGANQITRSLDSHPQWREEQIRKGLTRAAMFSTDSFNEAMAHVFRRALAFKAPIP